ncbi:MAG: hypothetical protein CL693_07490 [Cellvibrionaceae bacterium]|nr:hypothetical protein [Cellvibrionaceae bacterium]|tara:strand:+ start:46256 stop:46495 length:240 start_codon:yes stop_codon:yes gene_type:complete
MKSPRQKPKTLFLGDHKISCTQLEKQLQSEVKELNRRISSLQQNNRPNLDQVQHLGGILRSRQSVLNWLQIRDVIKAEA